VIKLKFLKRKSIVRWGNIAEGFIKRTTALLLTVIIILVVLFGGYIYYSHQLTGAPMTTTPTTMSPSLIKIVWVSGSTGGSIHLSTAAALAAIGNIENVMIIHQAGAGSAGVVLVTQGKADIGAGGLLDALDLYKNFTDLRVVLPVAIFPAQLVTRADSDIKSWRDLNGRAISIGSPAFIANRMFKEIMKVLNIKPSVIKELGHEESMNLLVTGVIDAYFFVGFPNPTVQEYAVKYRLKLVPPSLDELKIIREKLPYYPPFTVDASGGKVYYGIDIKFESIASWAFHYATSKLPEDVVYKIVKAYWENKKVAESLYFQHQWFKPSVVFNSAPIPLHAGVVKYYKEINVTVPPELIPPEYKP
jgi:TRAP transporter TAXI family solute receptor